MLGHRLTRSESSRNRSRSTFCNREHRIQNSLSCYQRHTCRESPVHRSRYTDRPVLCHRKFSFFSIEQFNRNQRLINRIFTIRNHRYNSPFYSRRNHAFVHDSPRLRHFRNDRSTLYHIAFSHCDMRLPEFLTVQCVHTDTTGDKCPALVSDPLQRSLNTVKDIIQDAGCQRNRHCRSRTFHKFSRMQSGSLLIHLYRRPVLIQGNDFANQLFFSHMDHFRHLKIRLPFQVNDRAVDAIYLFCLSATHPLHLPGTGISGIHSPVHL